MSKYPDLDDVAAMSPLEQQELQELREQNRILREALECAKLRLAHTCSNAITDTLIDEALKGSSWN